MILQSIALSELLPLLFSLCIFSLLPFSRVTCSRLTFGGFYRTLNSFPKKNAGTVYHCRLPPSADPLRGEH